ncbi:peptidase inhibitor family I36 protein [Nostoc sp. CALU 1950]|uniref:peptidase inhibitor family I36 protein n=1 Tax=Nostoc sp. CALU 1950 TaxID=3104321 RepID=UPI003EC0CA1A
MKTKLVSKLVFTLSLTTGILSLNWVKPDVAKAQTADCPLTNVCVWSERNFTGTRSVFTVGVLDVSPISTYSCTFNGSISTPIARSIRNNSLCPVNLYIDKNRQTSVNQVSDNQELADSGEFRSISNTASKRYGGVDLPNPPNPLGGLLGGF